MQHLSARDAHCVHYVYRRPHLSSQNTLCSAGTLSEPIYIESKLLDTMLLLSYSIPQVVGASIFPTCVLHSDFLRSGRCPR